MRFDRFLTLYFFYPFKRKLNYNGVSRIPVLMYHSISNNENNCVHPYYQTNTCRTVFAKHMRYLYENNYKVIGLGDALKILNHPYNFSINKFINFVVLTFDDGFRDFYLEAFPILQKYDFNAIVYLPTGFIKNRRKKFKWEKYLIWNEIRELHKKGIKFGSHTVTHPQLKLLNKNDIEIEIRQSKENIEDKLGESLDSFSYPYAFPEENKEFRTYLRGVLEKFDYKNGVSTRIGTITQGEDSFFLKRIPINSYDDIPFFKAKIEGGYDWLHKLQHLFKIFKKCVHM